MIEDAPFRKAMLCILEANQLSSKVADEVLRYRKGQPSSFGGLASGFNRIAQRLEALEGDVIPEKFNWSMEEKQALQELLKVALPSQDPLLSVPASKVKSLFFPEASPND